MSLPRYPDLEVTNALGKLPGHWLTKPLKWVATINDEALVETTAPDYLLEYVDIGSVSLSAGIEKTECLSFKDAPSRARRIVRDGDVLVSTVRTYLKAIAPIEAPPENLIASTGFAVVRPRQDLNSKFLKYALQCEEFVDEVIARSTGVSYPAINASDLARIYVPVPPDIEQRAIATFLDRETTKIDALIAEQEKLLTLLAEKRQATISHAVTKGLNPDAPMKDSGVDWLGEVPAHWDVRRVKDVSRLESGHTPSKQFPEYWENCEIPWVSLNDSKYLAANDYISDTAVSINELGLANSSARLLPSETVVFTRDATIGLAAITTRPMAVSQHLIAWCPTGKIESKYLLRVFNAMKSNLDSYTFGATIKTIGMGDVKKLVTTVPPLAEQAEIVRFLDTQIAALDSLTTEAIRAIDLLKERRTALISAAVTGKIDVRNVHPEQDTCHV